MPGSAVQLIYVVSIIDSTAPDWNSDVTPIEPNTSGGDNFEILVSLMDNDVVAGTNPTIAFPGPALLIDGSLSDGVNGTHPLNLTYSGTVSQTFTA